MAFWGISLRKRLSAAMMAAGWIAIAAMGVARAASLDEGSQACQECHGTSEWRMNDPVSGREIVLSIETAGFLRSSHGKVACRVCHDWGYGEIPHRGSGGHPIYECVLCHNRDPDLAHYRFDQRREEIASSAHGLAKGARFDCHTCHDPHLFRPVNDSQDAHARIEKSNSICLGCHGSERAEVGYADLVGVASAHKRLPSREIHFRKLKCIACHTPSASVTGHDVLPKERSLGECESCHTPNSTIPHAGNTNRGAFESSSPQPGGDDPAAKAYVIGASRSPGLERLSVIVFVATLLAIAVHGLARIIHAIRKRSAQ